MSLSDSHLPQLEAGEAELESVAYGGPPLPYFAVELAAPAELTPLYRDDVEEVSHRKLAILERAFLKFRALRRPTTAAL